MSTTLPTSTFEACAAARAAAPTSAPAQARRGVSLPDWLREPLLHFVILGGVLFAVDYFIASQEGDPRTIVVNAEVDNEIRQVFKASAGREPMPAEYQALLQRWLDNEVLYREGLALEVDKGDTAIRERVIFKALSVVDANVKLPAIDDKGLREWFESNRDKYDEPVRYDFQEAALAGETSESAVREFVDALNAGTPGDAKAGLRVFKGRPLKNLVQSYGADFPKELEAIPAGQWRALRTREGWRAMQLTSMTPSKPAEYEPLRGVVLQDWKDAIGTEQRTAAVRSLAKKYKVKQEAQAK
jgi:hypothetical protein